jgi:hypothetical protein
MVISASGCRERPSMYFWINKGAKLTWELKFPGATILERSSH